jgi:deoxyribodipyrimidine photo-lyase
MSSIVWFRQDLRVADNPALAAARALGGAVVPVYIHAPEEEGRWAPGGAARWWLHRSLERLIAELEALGSPLCLRRGGSLQELLAVARATGANRILWNRRYEPAIVARDQQIKRSLREAGLFAESHNSALLHEPWEVSTKSDTPFQVFTPFWRRCLTLPDPPEPLPAPTGLQAPAHAPVGVDLSAFELLPRRNWADGLQEAWHPGRAGAERRLSAFLEAAFADYANGRNRPDRDATSRLSPHLHFGEIGPREIWHAARRRALRERSTRDGKEDAWRHSTFLAEIGWREFAYHLLFHFPDTAVSPLRPKYARFPWRNDPEPLAAWQRGRTGYPIVDAGLRQLWQTGWMHNRVRMIVASFLVKDLLQPWNVGADWFWDTLVDADLASNTLGWQWAAGCGADAAPYFRIFNPVLQGNKFDPDGVYVRRWVPELALLPTRWMHEPWNAPPEVLIASKVELGANYPKRVVDHDAARLAALAALATLND